MCLELSSSGGQISTMSGMNSHQRGVCMPSVVSPLFENWQNSMLFAFSTGLWISLLFFVQDFSEPSFPWQLDLIFWFLLMNSIWFCSAWSPSKDTSLFSWESWRSRCVSEAMIIHHLQRPQLGKLNGQLTRERVTGPSGQMMVKMHNLIKVKCQA